MHVSATFEPFTPMARRAIVYAQEEARLLGDDTTTPNHLFLGILHADRSGVVQSLLGLATTDVRNALTKSPPCHAERADLPAFSVATVRVFQGAASASTTDLGNQEVDIGLYLLSVFVEAKKEVQALLGDLHIDYAKTRKHVEDWVRATSAKEREANETS